MGEVREINGPIVRTRLPGAMNGEQVLIGQQQLMGEVIGREGDEAIVQVYESTESLHPGESVKGLEHPLSVELGPGLLGQIFDGIQRPLNKLYDRSGDYIARGLNIPALDRDKLWSFQPEGSLQPGQSLAAGAVLGTVQESETITHRILVPPTLEGELLSLAGAGEYGVEEPIARVRDHHGQEHTLQLYQRWPVRQPRPYAQRDNAVAPLFTGQRILDTFFPLLKGGKAAVPGPFGAGKTVVQQQIARWSNADIVIYVGCGERGNELVDILDSFPQLTDPYSGRSLMERTLLVANTSNMPVVAREASLYTGITIAEYYRDQGYDVVMVADSTSRWAEALREVAGRLGQMPVEEGYPAYLASRLASFYERAGRVMTLNEASGSVSLIGAVSPPGGDFSEPVTSHTKEIVQTFWALSKELADARHYPAVSWTESFSEYVGVAAEWWHEHVNEQWYTERAQAVALLSQADELARIVNLVGPEALSAFQRWTLEVASLLKEAVLQQSALEDNDSYASPEKQFALLHLVIDIKRQGEKLLKRGVPVQQLLELAVLTQVKRLKSRYSSEQVADLQGYHETIDAAFAELGSEYPELETHE
ncbi:V-type ATP synthase subunit A [Thiohalophilus sp.]|uniref:V-type ATP synthase subunit A n=1 Tax=Thiohalophilus sp. TaxID=3028392 RepID=UPI002ACEE765|nr:V-type ATP synthase subunit A [Thiohalophilus sp.]MDZ7804272.1 V-type ATP synthase subunit A [Thiohalophilus sp.]